MQLVRSVPRKLMTETTNETFKNYSRPSDDMHHHTTLLQLQECRDTNDVKKKLLEEPLQELIQIPECPTRYLIGNLSLDT
jgi:hypothetical protein